MLEALSWSWACSKIRIEVTIAGILIAAQPLGIPCGDGMTLRERLAVSQIDGTGATDGFGSGGLVSHRDEGSSRRNEFISMIPRRELELRWNTLCTVSGVAVLRAVRKSVKLSTRTKKDASRSRQAAPPTV